MTPDTQALVEDKVPGNNSFIFRYTLTKFFVRFPAQIGQLIVEELLSPGSAPEDRWKAFNAILGERRFRINLIPTPLVCHDFVTIVRLFYYPWLQESMQECRRLRPIFAYPHHLRIYLNEASPDWNPSQPGLFHFLNECVPNLDDITGVFEDEHGWNDVGAFMWLNARNLEKDYYDIQREVKDVGKFFGRKHSMKQFKFPIKSHDFWRFTDPGIDQEGHDAGAQRM